VHFCLPPKNEIGPNEKKLVDNLFSYQYRHKIYSDISLKELIDMLFNPMLFTFNANLKETFTGD
jgi:hypothetical protein